MNYKGVEPPAVTGIYAAPRDTARRFGNDHLLVTVGKGHLAFWLVDLPRGKSRPGEKPKGLKKWTIERKAMSSRPGGKKSAGSSTGSCASKLSALCHCCPLPEALMAEL